MADRLPPEFLQSLQGQPGQPPPQGGPPPGPTPQIPPAPEYGMSLTQGQGQAQPVQPGMMGGGQLGPSPAQQEQPADPNQPDQTLAKLLASPPPLIDTAPKKKRPKAIDETMVRAVANAQEIRYAERNERIKRDIALWRQDVSFTPGEFDKRTDTAVVSPFIPNLVNKLANMLSAPEPRIIISFDTEQSKIASQAKENFGYWSRKQDKKYYGRSGGGSLQWDEFFYLLLHGMVVSRVLPDPDDDQYPFYTSLIDPAQCYPIFKGDKHGLHCMVRRYTSTAMDLIGTYGLNDPSLERKLQDACGYSADTNLSSFYNEEGDVIEYWDKYDRCVLWRDMVVMPVTEHGYGFVPFVVTVAKGEPKNMSTPLNGRSGFVDEFGNTGYGPSRGTDLANKATSVFHHLIQTNRIREVVHTLYLMEVEKALNPPTVTYVAPQYMNQDVAPLNLRKRGNNKRLLNFMKVEAVPTSPRPTDTAPLLNMIASDLAEGSLPPVAHGNEGGSNVSGFAVESLIAVSKDLTLPYTQAFELYLAQVIEMKLSHYTKFVLPLKTVTVPNRGSYGQTAMTELTLELMQAVPDEVEVKLWAMSQQMLPGQIQAASMAVQAGIWSLRKAMEHTGSLDPDRDFQDIISERAIQHPEIMENFLIPRAFIAEGNDQLAEIWNMLVVMPKMQAAMGAGGPGGGPPQPGGGPPQPGGGPQPNGQSNPANVPTAARSTGGGPQEGQGRGPGQ